MPQSCGKVERVSIYGIRRHSHQMQAPSPIRPLRVSAHAFYLLLGVNRYARMATAEAAVARVALGDLAARLPVSGRGDDR